MSQCLNCGQHPGYSKVDKTIKDFCSITCSQEWEQVHVARGDSIGFGHHTLLPIYEIRERETLLTMALIGDKEARRTLRRRYRLKAIFDPNKRQEVRL